MAQSQAVNVERLPNHMQDAARRYVEDGAHVGGFLEAVLSNDLVGAFGRADSANRDAMEDWVAWLYNDAPAGCWGSAEAVEQWQKQNGL